MPDDAERVRARRKRVRPVVARKKPSPTEIEPDVIGDVVHNSPAGLVDAGVAGQAPVQAVIQHLQQTHGNRAVSHYVGVQRAPAADVKTALSSGNYVAKFHKEIVSDLAAEMQMYSPSTGSAFATWKPGYTHVFMADVMRPFKAAGPDVNNRLTDVLGFWPVKEAVNRGRDQADLDEVKTPAAYKNAVALELRRLLSARVSASLDYLVPRYLQARNQVSLRHEALKISSAVTEPSPAEIVPSHPLDRYLIAGLVDGVLDFDQAGYRKANPAELNLHDRPKREIRFTFEADRGLKTWIRVSSPLDATAEEVATELYGDPSRADSLVVAAPRFGFHPRQLKGDAKAFWESVVHMPFGGDPALLGIDPLKEMLASPGKDEAALDQARNLKMTGASNQQVIDRLRLMSDAIDGAMPGPQIFGSDPRIGQLAARKAALDERAKKLRDGDSSAEGARWDAQSADQLDVIAKAAAGVKTAAAVAKGFHVTPADRDKIYGLPRYVWQPLNTMMMAYVEVLIASDLTVPARRLLAAADEKSQVFPIDMMEGILEYLRAELEPAATQTGSSIAIPFDVKHAQSLQQREQIIRGRLIELREKIKSDPGGVQTELKKLQFDLDNLQAETVVTANLAAVNDMWSTLFDHFSSWGVLTGKNDEYSKKMDRLNFWYLLWSDIVANFREKNYDKAKTKLYLLQKDGQFGEDLQSMATLLRDREHVEMWIDLVAKLGAMIGIGLLTAGMGTFVEGMLVGGAGWSAAGIGTLIVVSGAEAATFTALNVALFEKDPTILGVLAQLGENFLMFGAMRGISVGYAKFVGEAFAKSPAGRALGGVVQLETAALTSLLQKYVHKKIAGQNMTQAEAREVVLEALAFTVGMAVAARCFEPFMKDLRLRGVGTYKALFGEIDAVRRATARQGQALAQSGKGADIQKVLTQDAATMKQENALLEKIEQRSADPSAKAGERLSPTELAQVKSAAASGAQAYAGNKRAVALVGLPQVEGNHFVVSEGQLEPRVKLLTEKEVGFREQSRVVDPVSRRPTVELVNTAGETVRLTETSGAAATVIATPERAGGGPKPTGCFVAGTQVDGVTGATTIESLRGGDQVLATDPVSGRRGPQTVTRAYSRIVPELRDLRLGDTVLSCSPEHPFWVAGSGWLSAGDIAPGAALLDRCGGQVVVDAIETRRGNFTVYNVEVDGCHTYHVSAVGVLVHNKANVPREMSPELIARLNQLRANNADPEAIRQFEVMFESMNRDSEGMIRALDRMANKGDLAITLAKQYRAKAKIVEQRTEKMLRRTREKVADDSLALQAINDLIQLEKTGRVVGFRDWLAEADTRPPHQVQDLISELKVARELFKRVAADENLMIRYGQDAKSTGKSFDITIENRTTGDVVRSIDAKTKEPGRTITHIDDVRNQITAAAAKIPGAAPGSTKEAAIMINLEINKLHYLNNNTQVLQIQPNFDYAVTVVSNGKVTQRGNLQLELAGIFNTKKGRAQGIENLDVVMLVNIHGQEIMRTTKNASSGVWE